MPTTHIPTDATGDRSTPTSRRRSVWKHGVAAAAGAAAVTTLLAALASSAGVPFAAKGGGESIPILGFTELTFVFSLVGVGLAAVLARTVRQPRRVFVATTLVLTALSVVPDLTFGFDAASAAVLITLHVVAAAIVVPTLAARLARTR